MMLFGRRPDIAAVVAALLIMIVGLAAWVSRYGNFVAFLPLVALPTAIYTFLLFAVTAKRRQNAAPTTIYSVYDDTGAELTMKAAEDILKPLGLELTVEGVETPVFIAGVGDDRLPRLVLRYELKVWEGGRVVLRREVDGRAVVREATLLLREIEMAEGLPER